MFIKTILAIVSSVVIKEDMTWDQRHIAIKGKQAFSKKTVFNIIQKGAEIYQILKSLGNGLFTLTKIDVHASLCVTIS